MERLHMADGFDARVAEREYPSLEMLMKGLFKFEAFDKNGEKLWEEIFPNLVTTVGKDLALDTLLSGSAYTTTGPFMGMISSLSYTGVAAGDTMSAHPGWLEAGGANAPQYTGFRATAAFSAAAGGVKQLSASLSFSFTATGTVKGGFLVLGTGASHVIDNNGGTLFSAGLFTTGDRGVVNGTTILCQYQLSV